MENENQTEGQKEDLNKEDEKIEVMDTDMKPKKSMDFRIELILFLILGVLLGVMVKKEATRRVTVGFDDYRVMAEKHGVDINKIQKDLITQQKEAAESAEQVEDGSAGAATPEGACGI